MFLDILLVFGLRVFEKILMNKIRMSKVICDLSILENAWAKE